MTSTTFDAGKLKKTEVHNDPANIIACTMEVQTMGNVGTEVKNSFLSSEELTYIKNAIAEGLARQIVCNVAKRTVPAADPSVSKRYTPSPKEKEG